MSFTALKYCCHSEIKKMETYNVNILSQVGLSVLYSVWVCKRAFTSSSTQNGSLFPPMSAAARSSARYTERATTQMSPSIPCCTFHRQVTNVAEAAESSEEVLRSR